MFGEYITKKSPTFQPALLLDSPLSLKYGTFCIIHSYIWLNVNLFSDAELIACVIKSAYDKLPQALRRDEFFFDAPPVAVDNVDGVPAGWRKKKKLVSHGQTRVRGDAIPTTTPKYFGRQIVTLNWDKELE